MSRLTGDSRRGVLLHVLANDTLLDVARILASGEHRAVADGIIRGLDTWWIGEVGCDAHRRSGLHRRMDSR